MRIPRIFVLIISLFGFLFMLYMALMIYSKQLCGVVMEQRSSDVIKDQVVVVDRGLQTTITTAYRTPNDTDKPCVCSDTGHCIVYDLWAKAEGDFPCVPLRSSPPTTICIWPTNEDVYISKDIQSSGMWEGNSVRQYQQWLDQDKDLGVIDIGCNIGVYTLTAASMGRSIVAVEPNHEHVRRFHKSVHLTNFQPRITLLHGAVSDVRGNAKIITHRNNQGATQVDQIKNGEQKVADAAYNTVTGTILMNDILKYCHFKKAIMKIDIEGYEHRAFAHADLLFENIYIPLVLMEWAAMNPYYAKPESDEDKQLIIKMIDFFGARDYRPVNWQRTDLSMQNWDKWPRDIIWVHKTHTFTS